jgi:uncharacterized membrane protein YeaQ/YmgE (transglycosylase-associated protein family)
MPEFAMMNGFLWLVLGLLAGALARFFLPGKDKMGCLLTVLVGVAGAYLGGFLATLLGFGGFRGFDVYSLIVATLGAVLLLVVFRILRKGEGAKRG